MDEPIKYTRLDIERYLNQQMTKEEMYAFEKTMMDNPFLADALEGYQNADPQVTEWHLRDIEKNIATEKQEQPVAPVIKKQFKWWRVAAILLLAIGAGSVYYFNSLSKPSQNFAANAPILQQDSIGPEIKPATPVQIFPPKEKDIASNKKPATTPSTADEAASMIASAPATDTTLTAANQSLSGEKSTEGRELNEVAPQARLMKKNETFGYNLSTFEFNGKVLDEDGDPVAFATVKSKKGVGTVTDAKGNFNLKYPDSTLDVTISGMSYLPLTARLHAHEAGTFQLEESEKDLNDVVVSSMGKKKKFDVTIDKNEYLNKETGYKPLKGWRHLSAYLLSNINEYREEADEYNSGDVEIEFEVNKNGRPIDIIVVEANDEQNAEQAIKLIEKGPFWIKGKPGSKARLLVSF